MRERKTIYEKKILSVITACLLMILSTIPVFAQANSVEDVQAQKEELINIVLTSENPEVLKKANDSLNRIIEEEVKQNTINTANTTSRMQTRVGTQIRNYNSTTVSNYMDRKGAYGKAYTTGTSESKTVSVTVNVGTNFKIPSGANISIGATISQSATQTIKGPEYNTKVPGSNLNATHAVAIAILRGTIVHETFDYYDGSTGTFVSHVDRYVIGGATVTRYNLLVANTANGYYVGHCSNQAYKKYSNEQAFKNVINSTTPTPAYSW